MQRSRLAVLVQFVWHMIFRGIYLHPYSLHKKCTAAAKIIHASV